MNMKLVICLLLATGFFMTQAPLLAQEKPRRYTLPEDPAKAWGEVQQLFQGLRPPADWRVHEPQPESSGRIPEARS